MTKNSHSRRTGDANSRKGQQAPLSLESFAQRKGQVRALEEFHKRKDRKRVETAKALRSYRRVMKQEGFEAGKGASRKRGSSFEEVPSKIDDTDDGRQITKSDETENQRGTKKRKTNPFQKSLQKAEQNKRNAEQQKTDKTRQELERKQRLKERKIQSKLLAKRTRKGQPIMKNMAESLLIKLQKKDG
jgi:hypothetical protein